MSHGTEKKSVCLPDIDLSPLYVGEWVVIASSTGMCEHMSLNKMNKIIAMSHGAEKRVFANQKLIHHRCLLAHER
jgi:hypothetical protein